MRCREGVLKDMRGLLCDKRLLLQANKTSAKVVESLERIAGEQSFFPL